MANISCKFIQMLCVLSAIRWQRWLNLLMHLVQVCAHIGIMDIRYLCGDGNAQDTWVSVKSCDNNTVWCRYSAVNFLTTIHKRHPIARYKVSSVDPESDWYYAWVPALIYAMSYYIWTALSRHWTVYYYMVFIRRCISNEQNLICWRLVYFCKLILKCY